LKRRLAPIALLIVALSTCALLAQTARPSTLIDSAALLADLKVLSADDMEGRLVDSPGGAKARAYVTARFKASGVQPFGATYDEPFTFISGRGATAGEKHGVNVVGHIDGTRNPKRYIVVSAHYDHLGISRNGAVMNGADDNASGTAALFALAKYFSAHRPANSLIFAAFDAEESGEFGSLAFVKAPPVDVASIIVDVNMDMIGRDPDPKLFAVGAAANPVLKPFIEAVIPKAPVKFLFGHETPGGRRNSPDEDWSTDSDHHSFQLSRIPAVYLGVEDFAQHHQPTDKYETMSFDFYIGATETSLMVVQSFDANLDAIERAKAALPEPAPRAGGQGQAPPAPPAAGAPSSAAPADRDITLTTPTGAIAGSLMLPATPGKVPVALIIAGSGPTDRNGNSTQLPGPNNTYKMLAEALAKQGIASVRYDKRAIGASKAAATSEADLRFSTYVDDAAAWVTLLKGDARFSTVTVIGHSEGSLIGMVAAKQAGASAYVSLEGAGRNAADVLRGQVDPQFIAAGMPEMAKANDDILASLSAGKTVENFPAIPAFTSLYRASVQPYLISWFTYTPAVEIAKLTVPVLIIQGTTDIQVGMDDANALKAAKPDAEFKVIEGMNHVLKHAPADRAANVATYSDPSLPLVPDVPQAIVALIRRAK
jgi:hypothetical protein